MKRGFFVVSKSTAWLAGSFNIPMLDQNTQRAWQFVLAAFAITWTIGLVAAVVLQPLDRMIDSEGKRISLFIGRYGPTLAGFLMMYLAAGFSGVKKLFKQTFIWKVNPLYYVIAIFLPIAVKLAVLKSFGATFETYSFAFNDLVPLALAVGTYLFLGGGFGEEFGWRGYLLPILNERYTPLITSIIIGVVWTAWHVPAFLINGDAEETPLEVFAVFVLATSVLLTWLYYKTDQSVLLVALFHGCYNASGDWVRILFGKDDSEFDVSGATLDWYEALVMLALAFVLVFLTKGKLGFTKPATNS